MLSNIDNMSIVNCLTRFSFRIIHFFDCHLSDHANPSNLMTAREWMSKDIAPLNSKMKLLTLHCEKPWRLAHAKAPI